MKRESFCRRARYAMSACAVIALSGCMGMQDKPSPSFAATHASGITSCCASSPSLVFFDTGQFDITPEAEENLGFALKQYRLTGATRMELAGYTDSSGRPEQNQVLSQRRADAVKAWMAANGVPETEIIARAFGQNRPLVETIDGVREPQNRRVEISFNAAK